MPDVDDWAARVEQAAERWERPETEISLDRWRQAMLAKASGPGGIGSPEWRRRCQRAKWRRRVRHPWHSLGYWLYARLRRRLGDDD